jgi:hypothetical protein
MSHNLLRGRYSSAAILLCKLHLLFLTIRMVKVSIKKLKLQIFGDGGSIILSSQKSKRLR